MACDSEASLERVKSKSDSEEDTCFGVVWEKMPETVQTIQETVVHKGCKMISYREALEMSRYGEALRWSSDSEGEIEKSDGEGKSKVSCPFDGLIVPETELQNSPVKARVEGTETEMTVTEATATDTTSGKFVVNQTEIEEIEDEPLHSGGETEGSEFAPSDDEQEKNRKKTKRNQMRSPEKEKEKRKRRNNVKEVESMGRKRKKNVIDVDAILQSGSKDNITNKTVALMDEKQDEALTETAGISILKQAKKGLRVDAFKVIFFFDV